MNPALLEKAKYLEYYGITPNGLVSIIDPWRDLYGRNILETTTANSANWYKDGTTTISGELVTVVSSWSNYIIMWAPSPISGAVYAFSWEAKAGTVRHSTYCVFDETYGVFVVPKTPYALSDDWEKYTLTVTCPQGCEWLRFYPLADIEETGTFNIRNLQLNIGTLYPYAPPSGLPQTAIDYSGHGNTFQLGSAAGSDTNDPAWSGNGLVFGTDDYCKSSSPAFDDLPQFTCITVLNSGVSPTTARSIFHKNNRAAKIDGSGSRKLNYVQVRNSNYDVWTCSTSIQDSQNIITGFLYLASTPDVAPKIFLNISKETITRSSTGSGNCLSDASSDLYIGNKLTASESILSTIYCQLWYNRILSDAEYMQAYNGLKRLMNARGVAI